MAHDVGKHLHDRATRGEELSPEEHAQLDNWYATHDRTEFDELRVAGTDKALPALQANIDVTVGQLATLTRRIQFYIDHELFLDPS